LHILTKKEILDIYKKKSQKQKIVWMVWV
jgi:hypothetical protein